MSVQKCPTGGDAFPQNSWWWSLRTHLWAKIHNVLRFSSVKNWLTQMAAYWKQLWSWKRTRYIPMTTLFLLLFAASQADAQCCGAQTNIEVWLKAWKTTNYTDFKSPNNWRTNDGITRWWYVNVHQSILMSELGVWYGRLWQVQDDANRYTGDFADIYGSVMLAWSSGRSFIPYGGIQGWYIYSQGEWLRSWIPYEFSWGRWFWWPVAWANINIAELLTLWIGVESKFFLTNPDLFEWISAWNNPDSQGKWLYPGGVFLKVAYRIP